MHRWFSLEGQCWHFFLYILKNMACVSFTDQGNINHTHVMTSSRECIFDVNICCLNIVITLSVNQQEQIQIARNTFLCSLVLLSKSPQIHIDVITARNEVGRKVMFLQASVILSTGGSTWSGTPPLDQVHPPRTRCTPLGPSTPPLTRYTPQDQVHPQTRPGTTPGPGTPHPDQVHPPGTPPPQSMLADTVNARAVRILLECNLVLNDNYSRYSYYGHWAKSADLFLGRANITLQEHQKVKLACTCIHEIYLCQ